MEHDEYNAGQKFGGNFLGTRCHNPACKEATPLTSLGQGYQHRFMPRRCYDCQDETMMVTCFIRKEESLDTVVQFNCSICRRALRQEAPWTIIECDSCHERYIVYN